MTSIRAACVAAMCFALISCSAPSAQRVETASDHPLDPLTADEIRTATAALRDGEHLAPQTRVVILEIDEPDKARVVQRKEGDVVPRVARAVLYDWGRGVTVDALVDVRARRVLSSSDRPAGDPPVRHAILSRATEIAVADERVAAALRRRGVSDLNRLTFLGGVREGEALERRGGARFVTVTPFLWDVVGEQASLPGFFVTVNLTTGAVEAVSDFRGGRVGSRDAGTDTRAIALPRLVTSQPDGAGFRIRGSQIVWDRWRFHVAVHPRRGLEVFDVAFRDGNEYRRVLYRGSVAEVMTPYGDPAFGSWFPRDEGDYGMTSYSAARAQAIVGADAPEHAAFIPVTIAGTRGEPIALERAVAIYERDAGVLWRHAGEGRRARQLVLSSYTTLDNYDYLFHWTFNQDGAIDVQAQLTGVMNVRPAGPDHTAGTGDAALHFAHTVAPGVDAPNHQHFFSWRLDFDVDGISNRVFEINTRNAQSTLKDTVGEWFGMEQRPLRTERAAQRDINFAAATRWLVVNNGRRNPLGAPTAYAIVPGENAPPMQTADSAPRRRAPFLNHHLWVTRYNRAQMYASGESVNLPGPPDGVAAWSADDESIVDADVVLWYTHSVVHLPRPEDWPVMPAHTAGFRLVPVGFFGSNPVLDR